MRPPLHKLALGTVQFGLDYGLTSTGAAVGEAEVRRILALAARSGVTVLDTASAYGMSEAVLGRSIAALAASEGEAAAASFRIVTKLPSLRAAASAIDKLSLARRCFEQSLANLGVRRLHGLMLHDADDISGDDGAPLLELLAQWRDEGLVGRVGVSVYDMRQIDEAMRHDAVSLVQVPVNVFDQRLLAGDRLAGMKRRGIEVHARSALLQGLLLMEPQHVPAHLAHARPHLARYRASLEAANVSPLAAALGFVAGIPGIDHVVVGVHSARHLAECLAALDEGCAFDAPPHAVADLDIIDPRRWRPA